MREIYEDINDFIKDQDEKMRKKWKTWQLRVNKNQILKKSHLFL